MRSSPWTGCGYCTSVTNSLLFLYTLFKGEDQMGTKETSKIRNVGIIAHGGAGKTSLAEAVLFNTGMIDRLGRVDDGTSTMDFEPEEIKRKISITSSLDHCEWKECSIHMVDTPGYGNFIADTRACMRALDGA